MITHQHRVYLPGEQNQQDEEPVLSHGPYAFQEFCVHHHLGKVREKKNYTGITEILSSPNYIFHVLLQNIFSSEYYKKSSQRRLPAKHIFRSM